MTETMTTTRSKPTSLRVAIGNNAIILGVRAKPRSVRYDDLLYSSAEIILADGSKHTGITVTSPQDGGELCGIMIYLPETNEITDQFDGDFLAKLKRNKADVFPYRYRYSGWEGAYDHHIGSDGWSHLYTVASAPTGSLWASRCDLAAK